MLEGSMGWLGTQLTCFTATKVQILTQKAVVGKTATTAAVSVQEKAKSVKDTVTSEEFVDKAIDTAWGAAKSGVQVTCMRERERWREGGREREREREGGREGVGEGGRQRVSHTHTQTHTRARAHTNTHTLTRPIYIYIHTLIVSPHPSLSTHTQVGGSVVASATGMATTATEMAKSTTSAVVNSDAVNKVRVCFVKLV
jgi:hypothetical protein